ncbi:FCD domain-containing protein, partial [Enterococcus faecium]
EAAELYDVRAAVMRLAGLTLAPRVTDAELNVLSELVERMNEAAEAEDLNGFYPLNLRFHHLITEFGGNERLVALNNSLQREAHLFRRRTL